MKEYEIPDIVRVQWILDNYSSDTGDLGRLFAELRVHIRALHTAIRNFNDFVTKGGPAGLATEPGVIQVDPATKGFRFVPTSAAPDVPPPGGMAPRQERSKHDNAGKQTGAAPATQR